MAKINTYKLKDGIVVEDLEKLGFKEGSWLSEYKDIECMSKSMLIHDDIRLYMIIRTNPIGFNDFEDTLVLDDDFAQPYTPFYGNNYKNNVEGFPFLEKVIDRYNNVMTLIGIFDIAE